MIPKIIVYHTHIVTHLDFRLIFTIYKTHKTLNFKGSINVFLIDIINILAHLLSVNG